MAKVRVNPERSSLEELTKVASKRELKYTSPVREYKITLEELFRAADEASKRVSAMSQEERQELLKYAREVIRKGKEEHQRSINSTGESGSL